MLTPATTYKVALTDEDGLSLIEQEGSNQPGLIWNSLQDLINTADPTSRIELGAGTYRERLYINKAIQIVAQDSPAFDARTERTAPTFSVIFDGTNATEAWNGAQAMIQIEDTRMLTGVDRNSGKQDSSQVLIEGIEFRNNGSLDVQGQSGGITVNRSDATITNNYFHNLKSHDGAALLLLNDSATRLVNNLIWNNAATRWGAVMDTKNDTRGNLYAANSIRANTSKEGPALYQDFGGGFFLDNTVEANNAFGNPEPVEGTPIKESKGAVILRKDSNLNVALNRFIGNTVSNAEQPNSGALNIETEGSTNQVFLNLFSGNSVKKSIDLDEPTSRGGAIGVYNQSRPDISFNLFVDNEAGYGGSAIAASEWSVPTIRSNLFLNNRVLATNAITNPRDAAGTLFFEAIGSEFGPNQFEKARVYSNYFQGNSAPSVAGIFVGDKAGVDAQYNTFSASRIATNNNFMRLDALAVLITHDSADPSILADNTYVGPNPLQYHTWVRDNTAYSDLTMRGESFVVTKDNDFLTAYNYLGNVPDDIDNATSSFSDIAEATEGSSSFPLVTAALANSDLQDRSADLLLQQDFQGYDRQARTVDGAVETNPRSVVEEMDTVVWRFSKPGQPVHFYTASEAEKDLVIANGQKQMNAGRIADWVLDGPATNFNVSKDPLINYGNGSIEMELSPVYRLFNTISGTHLYTIDIEELYAIVTDLPNYNFEGIAFYTLTNRGEDPSGTATLQRFRNNETGSHFYTADPDEFASVKENLDSLNFSYDGPSFLAAQVAEPIV